MKVALNAICTRSSALCFASQNKMEETKEQHKADKANLEAVKAETRAGWEEAKAIANSEMYKAAIQKERDEQMIAAKKRKTEAQTRIDEARGVK